jgi:hypothetical protein
MRSEAVIWRDPGGALCRGRLEVGARTLLLAGTDAAGRTVRVAIPYTELAGVRLGRGADETVNGSRSLVFERAASPPLHVATVGAPGALLELTDVLGDYVSASAASVSRMCVVVPLRRGSRERAAALIERGPPFDPALFDRHCVFLTAREAVFVFEGEDVRRSVERLLRSRSLWRDVGEWRSVLAGMPRIGEEAYSWMVTHTAEGPPGGR